MLSPATENFLDDQNLEGRMGITNHHNLVFISNDESIMQLNSVFEHQNDENPFHDEIGKSLGTSSMVASWEAGSGLEYR